MPKPTEVTHTGLSVNLRKVDHEENPEDGAGFYEAYLDVDGVPFVIAAKKAGTLDKRRAALADSKAKSAADSPAQPAAPSA
jgi:hypothetical protein